MRSSPARSPRSRRGSTSRGRTCRNAPASRARSGWPRATSSDPSEIPRKPRQRLARITAASDGSAFGLNIVYSYTDRVTSGRASGEESRVHASSRPRARRDVLIEYTMRRRKKELESAVKKAHSDELAKQAMWELSKGKLAEAQRRAEERAEICPRTGSASSRSSTRPSRSRRRSGPGWRKRAKSEQLPGDRPSTRSTY